MTGTDAYAHASLKDALHRGPPPAGNLAIPVLAHGSLVVELYVPKGHVPQTPHTRDEVYVVARGSAVLVTGVDRRPADPGSFLFVAAGHPHQFEDISSDFAVWVIFYGPEGGEVQAR